MKPAKYRHSPSIESTGSDAGTQRGGCPSCVENTCSCDYMASYDIYDQLLVPMSDGSYYWSNNGPPKYLHRFPCCFDITIRDFSSKSIEESWCQDAENINGDYVSSAPENCDDLYSPAAGVCPACTIAHIPLCTSEKTDSTFSYLRSYLVLGIDDDTVLIDSTVYPLGLGANTTYYNSNREYEGRPQLYIFAITELHLNLNHCQCLSTYYFKTNIGEFNGDYYVLAGSPPTIVSPVSEDCGVKYYHGDYDGRYVEYEVSEADLWEYDGSPAGYYHDEVQPTAKTLPMICNFGTINIRYRNAQTPYNILTEDSHGSDPTYVTVSLAGITSVNPLPPESGDITACSGCENLNTSHRLLWRSDIPTFGSDAAYYKNLGNICCDCQGNYDNNAFANNPSGICIAYMKAYLDDYVIEGQYSNVVKCEIYGSYFTGAIDVNGDPYRAYDQLALYEYYYNDWQFGSAPDLDLNNVTLNLNLMSHSPIYSGVCSFVDSAATITFGEGTHIECVAKAENCIICHDRIGPDNIQVDIPNGWVFNDLTRYLGWTPSCKNTHLFNGSYILTRPSAFNIASDGDGCIWGYEVLDNWAMYGHDLYCGYITTGYYNVGDCCTVAMRLTFISSCSDMFDVACNKWGLLGPHLFMWETRDFGIPSGSRYISGANNKIVVILEVFFDAGADRLIFAGLIDPIIYGTSILCDPYRECECPDQTRSSVLGGQYIDCSAINNLQLDFYGHFVGGWDSSWLVPIRWDRSPVFISVV